MLNFISVLSLLIASTQAFANSTHFTANVNLTAESHVTLSIDVTETSKGVSSSFENRISIHGDEDYSWNTCDNTYHFQGVNVSVSAKDESGNILDQKEQTLDLISTFSAEVPAGSACAKTFPKNVAMNFFQRDNFISLHVPYQGKTVSIDFSIPARGTVVVANDNTYSSSVNSLDLSWMNYFVNNGQGVNGDGRGPYCKGATQIVDPSKPASDDSYVDPDHE